MQSQPPVTHLTSQGHSFSLKAPIVMGVLNMTTDSFSDGGRYIQTTAALQHARQMIRDGADWLDIGAESSGPGSSDVSAEEELQRLLPVIRSIREESDIWISVDTYKAEVARQVIEAGANVINDVTALRGDSHMVHVLSEKKVPVILMYSKDPTIHITTDGQDYDDVIQTIQQFFEERLSFAQTQGISPESIILDPGMGFFLSGKAKYSFEVIRRLPELVQWGYPLMIGTSRKSFMAHLSPGKTLAPHERELPTAITSAMVIWQGALLIRVHDVAQGRMAVDTIRAIQGNFNLDH